MPKQKVNRDDDNKKKNEETQEIETKDAQICKFDRIRKMWTTGLLVPMAFEQCTGRVSIFKLSDTR